MAVPESLATDSAIERDMATLNVSDSDFEHAKLAADLIERCNELLAELDEFQAYMKEKKKENAVNIGSHFSKEVQSELRRFKNLPLVNSKRGQILAGSNFPYYEALWYTAKRTSGITAIRTIYRYGRTRIEDKVFIEPLAKDVHDRPGEVIDIVSRNGLEWVKVSTITERRIVFDLAKSGWVEGDSSDDDDEDYESDGILKLAFNLTKLAKSVRARYRNPTVRLVLPRIHLRQCKKEVQKVLQKIKDLGVILETADDIPEHPLPISDVRDRMIPDPFDDLSDTLNVDTTVLLAFASDLSHGSVEPNDWHQRMIAWQIKMEKEEPMLLSVVWPACGSRKLVCTRDAADRALQIVDTLATETERKRMELILNVGDEVSGLSREQRLQGFQKLSKHHVPSDWCLPIEIIDVDVAKIKTELLSPAVDRVSHILTGVNISVFLYGWASGHTTMTSNRAVSLSIERTIEENRVGEEMGPAVWIIPQSRSLVGKEKQRRGAVPEDAESSDHSD